MPAAPAITLAADRVAVIAASRECRPIADALVDTLHTVPGLVVDPRADVRLEVSECEMPRQEVHVDIEIADSVDRRRLSVDGAAHALVAVRVGNTTEAHLIGATRTVAHGSWNDAHVLGLSRTVERTLTDGVAADLAEQIRPLPRFVERRLYANPAPGTGQDTYNLAVRAEAAGEILEAHRLAVLAQAQYPSERTTAYADELAQLARARGLVTPR